METLAKQVTSKTFKTMNFDDWFGMLSTAIIGIGFFVLMIVIYNSITK